MICTVNILFLKVQTLLMCYIKNKQDSSYCALCFKRNYPHFFLIINELTVCHQLPFNSHETLSALSLSEYTPHSQAILTAPLHSTCTSFLLTKQKFGDLLHSNRNLARFNGDFSQWPEV